MTREPTPRRVRASASAHLDGVSNSGRVARGRMFEAGQAKNEDACRREQSP